MKSSHGIEPKKIRYCRSCGTIYTELQKHFPQYCGVCGIKLTDAELLVEPLGEKAKLLVEEHR